MRTGRIPRNTRWSFSQLVREHGEEEALALLQYQPGLGAFAEAPGLGPDLPLCYAATTPMFIRFGRGR